MTHPVIRKLIAKEMYLHRGLMTGTLVAGLASILLSYLNLTAFNICAITYITAIVAFAIMLVMLSVVGERKDKSLLFVLSLPLSGYDYFKAKMLGVLLTFLVPWCVLTAAALARVGLTHSAPHGLVPFALLLSLFMLGNFCLVLVAALISNTEGWVNSVVILTNMSITFFVIGVARMAAIAPYIAGDRPVWNGTVLTMIAGQLLWIVLVLGAAALVRSAKRDFF